MDEPHENAIPEIFQCYLTDQPFSNCIVCEKELLDSGAEYFVEKAVKEFDVIFEYAICKECAEEMRQKLSKESQEMIQDYFTGKVDFEKRFTEKMEKADFDPDNWISNCAVTGKPRNDLTRYQVFGHFIGKEMVFSVAPYMISEEATTGMAELLSKATKDELNGFVDDHFGGPPEFRELIKKKDLIFI